MRQWQVKLLLTADIIDVLLHLVAAVSNRRNFHQKKGNITCLNVIINFYVCRPLCELL